MWKTIVELFKKEDENRKHVHVSYFGRLHISDVDFFRSKKVQETIKKSLNSSIYKNLKGISH